MSIGKKTWVFPDGDIPQSGDKEPFGHESLIVLNTGTKKATIKVTVYFENKEPYRDIVISVEAERVRCFRMDHGIGDQEKVLVPFGQYALKLESDLPVIAQIGRMDVTQPNLAYYTVMGHAE
jgi:hypothetical protein